MRTVNKCFNSSLLQTTTEKHRMSFPETVDEILDVSEDEGTMAEPLPRPHATKVVELISPPSLPLLFIYFDHFFVLLFFFLLLFFRNRTANVRYDNLSSPCAPSTHHSLYVCVRVFVFTLACARRTTSVTSVAPGSLFALTRHSC